jgi:acetyl esterase/lipase
MTAPYRVFLFAAAILLAPSLHLQAQQAAAPVKLYGEIPTPEQPEGIALLKQPSKTALPEQWQQRGKDNRAIRNISTPTLTPVLPDAAKATGVGVIVAPGGAFYMLAIDNEGFMPARWLADHGIAAFVLKYRTQETPRDDQGFEATMSARMKGAATDEARPETPPEPIEDAKAAVRLVRERAKEWHVDPTKIGFLGFSAGAMTALSVGLVEDQSSRPDFIAPIYPPMLARTVPSDAPPMFVAIALDDPLFAKGKSLELIAAWRNANRPIEAHLYERGGHGFGMGSRSAASALWIDQFYAWMQDRGLFKVTQ